MTLCERQFANLRNWGRYDEEHKRIEMPREIAKAVIDTLTMESHRCFSKTMSKNAGYKIEEFDEGWISCLGNRFEVNFHKGGTYNIWIKES